MPLGVVVVEQEILVRSIINVDTTAHLKTKMVGLDLMILTNGTPVEVFPILVLTEQNLMGLSQTQEIADILLVVVVVDQTMVSQEEVP